MIHSYGRRKCKRLFVDKYSEVCVLSRVLLCDPMEGACLVPVRWVLRARILEWVAMFDALDLLELVGSL